MENKILLNQEYYFNKNGNMNKFCFNLDCLEQIMYFSIKDLYIDHNLFFSDDINLAFDKINKQLGTNKVYVDSHLIHCEPIIGNVIEIFKEMDRMLDVGKMVVIRTMIDMLPPYEVFNPGSIGEKNGHSFLIVGYSDTEYYFVDSPYILNKDRCEIFETNKSIIILKKNDLRKAFEVYKEVSYIDIDVDYFMSEVSKKNIESILKDIPRYYHSNVDDEDVVIGKKALVCLLEFIRNESESEIMKLLYDFYFSHLMISKRILLKDCLENKEQTINCSNLINKLEESILLWENFKNKLVKIQMMYDCMIKNTGYENEFRKVEKKLIQIIELEDEISECINIAL